ncbi:methylenetetrahydrofolate reductase [Tropicimonas sp. S265A]|uniref:methylenetetrahydrofolate reductase n=1 Tax=Tropicimonas sp. S265A TaxID=3415134 RepID=UPI003C7E82A4
MGTPVDLTDPLNGFSLEVMPRTAAKIDSFRDILPQETRIYIAHLDGTPFADMLTTAKRLRGEGFEVMPHVPARIVRDAQTLEAWLRAYRDEAGVDQALVLAGGVSQPLGDFESSIQLLETGLFDKHGFKRLHMAGHPEGNRDIDPDGSTKMVDQAATWKQAFSERSDAQMALVTQFAFEAAPVIDWARRYAEAGIDLPIHVGIAGPAKLQTLLKFAIACGVGQSLRVLQKRARDVTKLLKPIEPTQLLSDLTQQLRTGPQTHIAQVHVFPLGGIRASADYMAKARDEVKQARALR